MNPKALDGYEILEEIGQGPSATVYLARHQATRKQVALKLFHESAVADRDTIRALHREVVISSGLEHANIVRVFDINETGGRHYIAMDYVDGVPLNRLLEHYKRFETVQACRIVQGMAAGLSYAHRSGISHGSLVPENVLIESQTGRVVLTDFGISRTMARSLGQGVPPPERVGFLAPEQLAGSNPDDRTDLFALGGMLYYLLTGRRPAPGTVSKPGAALPQMPGLRSLLPNLPIWLETVVARCMSAEPHERFDSTTDLIDELEAGLEIPDETEGDDLLAPTPTAPTEEPAPRIQSRTGDMKLLRAKTAGGTLGMLMRGKNAPVEPESSVKNAERRLLELSFETRSRRPSRRTSASRPGLSEDRPATPTPPPPPETPEVRTEEPALTDWFKDPSRAGHGPMQAPPAPPSRPSSVESTPLARTAPPPPRPAPAAPPRTEAPTPPPAPPRPAPAAPPRTEAPSPPAPPRPAPAAPPRTEAPTPPPAPPRPAPAASPRTEAPTPPPAPPRPAPAASDRPSWQGARPGESPRSAPPAPESPRPAVGPASPRVSSALGGAGTVGAPPPKPPREAPRPATRPKDKTPAQPPSRSSSRVSAIPPPSREPERGERPARSPLRTPGPADGGTIRVTARDLDPQGTQARRRMLVGLLLVLLLAGGGGLLWHFVLGIPRGTVVLELPGVAGASVAVVQDGREGRKVDFEDGQARVRVPKDQDLELVVSAVGYLPKTIPVRVSLEEDEKTIPVEMTGAPGTLAITVQAPGLQGEVSLVVQDGSQKIPGKTRTGALELEVPTGRSLTVQATAPGYVSQPSRVTLDPATGSASLQLKMVPDHGILQLDLQGQSLANAKGTIRVLDGTRELAKAPLADAGKALEKLPLGRNLTVKVSTNLHLPGQASARLTPDVPRSKVTLSLQLAPRLKIDTVPWATVLVGDSRAGQADAEGVLTLTEKHLKELGRQYEVRASREGFKTATRTVRATPGQSTLSLALTPLPQPTYSGGGSSYSGGGGYSSGGGYSGGGGSSGSSSGGSSTGSSGSAASTPSTPAGSGGSTGGGWGSVQVPGEH